MKETKSNNDISKSLKLLGVMKPLINQYLLPAKYVGTQVDLATIESRLLNDARCSILNSRRKFTQMDDNFLVLGL